MNFYQTYLATLLSQASYADNLNLNKSGQSKLLINWYRFQLKKLILI